VKIKVDQETNKSRLVPNITGGNLCTTIGGSFWGPFQTCVNAWRGEVRAYVAFALTVH